MQKSVISDLAITSSIVGISVVIGVEAVEKIETGDVVVLLAAIPGVGFVVRTVVADLEVFVERAAVVTGVAPRVEIVCVAVRAAGMARVDDALSFVVDGVVRDATLRVEFSFIV